MMPAPDLCASNLSIAAAMGAGIVLILASLRVVVVRPVNVVVRCISVAPQREGNG